MKEIDKAILRTLAYADLFDYPLRDSEVWQYLISSESFPFPTVVKHLHRIVTDIKVIGTNGTDLYFLLHPRCDNPNSPFPPLHPRGGSLDSPGVGIIKLRHQRASHSRTKLKKAAGVARWLRLIPTVHLIGVTGALAMLNAGKKDDIDLMFVVSPRRVWLTRGLIVFVLRLLGRYRRPGKTQDRICPNLFLDTEHLGLAVSERNLFTAHEIAQTKCLWEKEGTYDRFLAANRWVLEYLPNAFIQNQKSKIKNQNVVKKSKFCILLCHYSFCTLILDFLEKMAFKAQLFYMHSKRTREITEPGRIFFHPRDRGSEILLKYQKRLTELGIKP